MIRLPLPRILWARHTLTTNEHGAIKYRTAKDEPLHGGRRIMLGTLDHDVKGIEAILKQLKAKGAEGILVLSIDQMIQ